MWFLGGTWFLGGIHLYGKKFIWKFSATSHGKGVVDGIGGNVKSNVRRQVMSMKKDRPNVQDSESFAKLAQKLVPTTNIKHFSEKDIVSYKKTDPFKNSIPVNGIFNMHVMVVDGSNTHLWRNSAYHRMGAQADIKIERNQNKSSDDDETQNAVLVIDNSSLCYHDVVKIASGNFEGYYAVITEEGENLMNLQINDEIEINYLKKSFGKWIVAPHDLDSRMIIDLKKVICRFKVSIHYTEI